MPVLKSNKIKLNYNTFLGKPYLKTCSSDYQNQTPETYLKVFLISFISIFSMVIIQHVGISLPKIYIQKLKLLGDQSKKFTKLNLFYSIEPKFNIFNLQNPLTNYISLKQ